MRKSILITLTLAATFCLGFAFKTIITTNGNNKMKKVTGIGGIFFKCKDPKRMTEWYQKNLGLKANPYGGATFEWYEGADSTKKGQTQWQPFPETTKYFEPLNLYIFLTQKETKFNFGNLLTISKTK